jgi:tetratricopeptide (TPR) repeat protein
MNEKFIKKFAQLDYIFSLCIMSLFLFIISCERQTYPVAAVDPIPDIHLVEDHSEVLVDWMKKGYKNKILINVDHHDDLRYIPEHKINHLQQLFKEKKWDEILRERDKGVQSLFVLADFIYAAHRLGIVERLYWVATSGLLEAGDREGGARSFLRAFGYPDEIINTFRQDSNAVTGNIFGITVTISSIKNLPEIKEPILLTIDNNYFSNRIQKTGATELMVIKDFLTHLQTKKLEIQHLSIAYSVHGDYTPITDRHLAEEIFHILQHPEIIKNTAIPKIWGIRDRGFALLRSQRGNDALTVFSEFLPAFPDEPTLILGKAIALSMMEKDSEALSTIRELLIQNPEYDYVYLYLGKNLGSKGMVQRAQTYLEEYLKRHPGSFYGLMTYGDIFYHNKMDKEAFEMYQRVLVQGEYINAVMYAGDALFHLGKHQEAMKYYERGLGLLNEVGYRSLRNFPESVRNMTTLKSQKSSNHTLK